MRYQTEQEYRIVRTIHQITVTDYGTVKDLIEALSHCPPDAKIIYRDIDEDGDYILTFQKETKLDEGVHQ